MAVVMTEVWSAGPARHQNSRDQTNTDPTAANTASDKTTPGVSVVLIPGAQNG